MITMKSDYSFIETIAALTHAASNKAVFYISGLDF